LAWLRALSLGLLGVILGSTPAEAKPFAYVTNAGANTVSVIDTATNTVVATVPVGVNPTGVAITPDGTRAYVSGIPLSVIDTATNTEVATVLVGTRAFGVAITPVKFACPLGQGLWKNHPDTWPVTSLTLGSQSYTQAELLTLFDTPPRGDG
jgi:YVTN family beta-propeller protein